MHMKTRCFDCNTFTGPNAAVNNKEVASLLLAIETFVMLEGPFWRKIRGKGLAYSYNLYLNVETGTLNFAIEKSTSPVAAFDEARKIIGDYEVYFDGLLDVP